MANYPNSVWSPSAKAAGNTIDASFFNDPQDEIVAIESGLTQGTAPLNSSRSTVVALSVTAGSTFGARPVMPPPHIAVVFLETTKTLGTSQVSTMSWNAQGILTNSSMHSTGTDPERLTPQSTGVYRVSAQVGWSVADAAGFRFIALLDSSGGGIAQSLGDAQTGANPNAFQITGYKRFDALGGYVTCSITQVGQTTLSVSTGMGATWMALEKL